MKTRIVFCKIFSFIDVLGPSLNWPLTIGKIYRPPHDNNNNENISKFIAELSPIIELLQSENNYATVVGDFNINLLQINEREKVCEFFDMMCINSFFAKITLPTRHGTHSCSLIDQMFCKVPHKQEIDISSSIIISTISDHFPCIVNLRTPGEGRKQEKLIYTRIINDSVINYFREELSRLAWMLICCATQISTTGSSKKCSVLVSISIFPKNGSKLINTSINCRPGLHLE